MIKLRDIAVHLPADSIDNLAQGASFGETEDFIKNKVGATRLTRRSPDSDTSDLAVAAANALLDRGQLLREMVDALIVVTQNPDGEGLPHTSAIVQNKLQLPKSVAAFDISLGCSGFVYGLAALRGFMEASGLNNGMLITADPYSKIVDPSDRVTSLLFGDGATASWLSRDGEWSIGAPVFGTDGAGAEHLVKRSGRLSMNGRQVFNFAAFAVPRQINELLSREGLTHGDVDSYCVHQGSAVIVDTVARKFPAVADRFARGIENCGNTISSTIPILLEKRIHQPAINRILVSGFGVGLSWATALLSRQSSHL